MEEMTKERFNCIWTIVHNKGNTPIEQRNAYKHRYKCQVNQDGTRLIIDVLDNVAWQITTAGLITALQYNPREVKTIMAQNFDKMSIDDLKEVISQAENALRQKESQRFKELVDNVLTSISELKKAFPFASWTIEVEIDGAEEDVDILGRTFTAEDFQE